MKNKKHFCNRMPHFPTKEEWLEQQYKNGAIIRKEDLVNGVLYFGECRNADIAYWSKDLNKFIYKREKFGQKFFETIEHPEDENGFDVFIPHLPVKEVLKHPYGIVYYSFIDLDQDIPKTLQAKQKSVKNTLKFFEDHLDEFLMEGYNEDI